MTQQHRNSNSSIPYRTRRLSDPNSTFLESCKTHLDELENKQHSLWLELDKVKQLSTSFKKECKKVLDSFKEQIKERLKIKIDNLQHILKTLDSKIDFMIDHCEKYGARILKQLETREDSEKVAFEQRQQLISQRLKILEQKAEQFKAKEEDMKNKMQVMKEKNINLTEEYNALNAKTVQRIAQLEAQLKGEGPRRSDNKYSSQNSNHNNSIIGNISMNQISSKQSSNSQISGNPNLKTVNNPNSSPNLNFVSHKNNPGNGNQIHLNGDSNMVTKKTSNPNIMGDITNNQGRQLYFQNKNQGHNHNNTFQPDGTIYFQQGRQPGNANQPTFSQQQFKSTNKNQEQSISIEQSQVYQPTGKSSSYQTNNKIQLNPDFFRMNDSMTSDITDYNFSIATKGIYLKSLSSKEETGINVKKLKQSSGSSDNGNKHNISYGLASSNSGNKIPVTSMGSGKDQSHRFDYLLNNLAQGAANSSTMNNSTQILDDRSMVSHNQSSFIYRLPK